GGIARLRVYGEPIVDWSSASGDTVELSAITSGGRVVGYNNSHYGDPWVILTEGRGADMGDGWETRRRREPGNDWIIVQLGCPGIVEKIEVDTAHFKGNYPDMCSVQAALMDGGTDASTTTQAMFWPELLAPQKLQMDNIHTWSGSDIAALGPVSHVKLNSIPDGGISRFRIFGKPA
ncbi:MAG: allantoicase, partial [Alphaproteobacteria bacterium]|nr:allantoicase [Alphaproteobacteria bacterium]